MKHNKVVIASSLIILLLSGCSSEQIVESTFTPTVTITHTPTITPTKTLSPSPTQIPTATPTPTPISSCNPGGTIQGEIDYSLPGFVDIVSVNTYLVNSVFTVIFTVREIPEKIEINRNGLYDGQSELSWGIGIDLDNKSYTGGRLINGVTEKQGYDNVLVARHSKDGPESSNSIQNIFVDDVFLFDSITELGYFAGRPKGSIVVDQNLKTITLKAFINGISPYSDLYFFAFFQGSAKRHLDELCIR